MIRYRPLDDVCREIAAHSASKRQPPPAPYTAADPVVPPELAVANLSAVDANLGTLTLGDKPRFVGGSMVNAGFREKTADEAMQIRRMLRQLCGRGHDDVIPRHAAAFTAEILADAIFERAASDGALHRSSLIDVLRRYGIAP